jgi:hypothetical protein
MLRLPLPSNLVAYKRILGTDPAAGIECSDAVPAGKSWVLLAYLVDMVQGITQTPQPILQIDDGANVIHESLGCSAAQAISTTCRYIWAPAYTLTGQVGATPNIRAFAPLAELILGAGYRVRTATLGIGANSNYGAPVLYVAEIG